MTLQLSDFRTPLRAPAPKRASAAKPKRKLRPAMWVVDAMPRRKWLTAAQIAVICKRGRKEIHPHLFYARTVGALQHKHDGECPCCGKPIVLWRRP